MARLRPVFVGALILVLAALFGQDRLAVAGPAGFAAYPAEAIESGGAPAEALVSAAMQIPDDSDEDLTDFSGAGQRSGTGHDAWRPVRVHADVTPRRGRPRSTGPPAQSIRA